MAMSKPVRRGPNERHNVYRQVRDRIIALDLLPGSAISENELSKALNVSRTPIREAMLLLAEENMVEVFPKIGTFVSRVDQRRVTEAQFLREAVELASLRSLRPPFNPDVVQQLRNNLDQQDKVGDDLRAFFSLDESFHRGLMAMAGHEGSWATVVAAKGHLDRARMLGIQQIPRFDKFIEDHRAIFQAVIDGSLDHAEKLLASHLRVVFEDIEAIRATSPDLFVGPGGARPVRRSAYVWESTD